MPTLKENYEAIDAILFQNQEEILKEIDKTIGKLTRKIKEYREICIPILRDVQKPEIIWDKVNTEDEKEYWQYKMKKTKCIVLDECPQIDKESLQALLDSISPTKLVVEEVEEMEHILGRAYSYKYRVVISLG